jgi:hypothetical protein
MTATMRLIEARQELMVLHNQFDNVNQDNDLIDSVIYRIQAKEKELKAIRPEATQEYSEAHPEPVTFSEKPKSKVVKLLSNILNLIP